MEIQKRVWYFRKESGISEKGLVFQKINAIWFTTREKRVGISENNLVFQKISVMWFTTREKRVCISENNLVFLGDQRNVV